MDNTRYQELIIIKTLIDQYYNQASSGFFDCRNVLGDNMFNLFQGKYFQLDICYDYEYFEVFGTTKCEFNDLQEVYEKLSNEPCSIY